ncbi:MAG TPA: potassium channel family protein [Terriglobales bacterium]|nr:potassium channel family protein [Terriglobales bacterium]
MTILHQAAAAVLLLILTLWFQCLGVAVLIEWLKRVMVRGIYRFGSVRAAALVVQTTIAMMVLHGLVILLWAGFYRLRCFPSWELAFYFSGSTYATVGYGDVTLPYNWRLLGPLESMTGVLMCGVSVSILFAVVTRLFDAQDPEKAIRIVS